jgi:hypothetical protein
MHVVQHVNKHPTDISNERFADALISISCVQLVNCLQRVGFRLIKNQFSTVIDQSTSNALQTVYRSNAAKVANFGLRRSACVDQTLDIGETLMTPSQEAIENLLASKYEELFSCASNGENEMSVLMTVIDNDFVRDNVSCKGSIANEIRDAVDKHEHGNGNGYLGLSSDHCID